MNPLQTTITLQILLLFTIGYILAVITNFLADRLPFKVSLLTRTCQYCKNESRLFSYLLIKPCDQASLLIKTRSRLITVLLPISLILLWLFPHEKLWFGYNALIITYFFLVLVIDIEHKLILHSVSIVGVLLAIPIGTLLHGIYKTLLGGIAGFFIMLSFYMIGIGFMAVVNKIKNQPSDEIALGFGDVSLSTIIGFLLGWPGITIGILIAILAGGLVSALLVLWMLVKQDYQPLLAIPYGPFLILSAILLLYFL